MRNILLFSLMALLPLAAQDLRIAVVDMTTLFNEHPQTKAAEERVDAARKKAREAFLEKSKGLKLSLEKHQALLLAGKVAEGEKELEKAREAQRELAAMKSTQERDLEKQFLEEKRKILLAVRSAVQTFNKEAGYALVLDRSAAAESGIPMVVDVNGLTDITDAVTALLKK